MRGTIMGALLQHHHWTAFAHAIAALKALPAHGDVLMALLHVIERAIPATLVRFCALDPHTLECIGVNTHLLSTGGEDLDVHSPIVLARCPLVMTQLRSDAPPVLKLTDIVRSHVFWGTQSWEVYYRPASSRYTMSARLSPPGHAPIITIDLDRDLGDFNDEEACLLELLRPHLREAYERVCAIERGRRPAPTPGLAGLTVTLDAEHRPINAARRPATPAIEAHALPTSLREAVWLHYGSLSRDDLDHKGCAFERTIHDADGALHVSMAWNPATTETRIATRIALADVSGWRALLRLGLTEREAEVLFWVAEGKSNDVVGRVLGVSGRTVQKHVENVHRKLGVESRTAAAAVALRALHGAR